ncbi:putative ORFan [Tupanvirus deep ocean]|uniref:ORFan n=2 Tax=Tupanvirus TaxID=2094720 RepID=A0AC62A877_9VIRU|nr:putative ORFan [Tupanvirus deep ocean]QKU33919.1 putative ORFan [Tupanvirus deep ocean]
MVSFFNELDIVYCLCIPSRKNFVTEQVNKLGITDKIKIIDAYDQDSPIVKETIKNHLVFSIYTNNPVVIACNLGVRKIMMDIVENKYDYALVIEDDVIFIDEMFDHANKWITKNTISKNFNMSKPYVLHLQCSLPENNFYNKNVSQGGIIKKPIRYGEPAYITNHHSCAILLKHFFPITAPFDDYKNLIKQHYSIQQGILVPYVCRELSGNYFNFDTNSIGHTFTRTLKNNISIYDTMIKEKFYVNIEGNNGHIKIYNYLLKKINPKLSIVINSKEIPENVMVYSLGCHENLLQNNYIMGGTLDDNITNTGKPSFIISVRGMKSFKNAKNKLKLSPVIGDILLLYNQFIRKKKKGLYQYCFIYDTTLKIECNDKFILVNPSKCTVETLLNVICSSKYVISDDINYITIANSYSVFGIYAIIDNTTTPYNKLIAEDYFSNFSNKVIQPINLNIINKDIIIENNFKEKVANFPQPVLPIKKNTIKLLADICPFLLRFHIMFRKGRYVQVVH